LSTPYLGVGSAFAATPTGPAAVTITSQTTGFASALDDGTDTKIKVSANVTVPGTGESAVASVRFTYTPVDALGNALGATVAIGTDTTAPYSALYNAPDTPVGTAAYREAAEALSSTGSVIGQDTVDEVVKNTNSTVHISAPAEGATIGRSAGGNIVVSGTRSADKPALSITARTRDNSDGSLGAAGAATAVAAGGTTAAWSTNVAAPACPNTAASGCDVVINAAVTGATGSDETTQAGMYNAVLTSFTVAPTDVTTPTGVNQTFVVTALDQNTQPVGNIAVTVTEATTATEVATPAPTNGGTATGTATGASGTTGVDGKFTFISSDTVAEVTTFTIKSGAGSPVTDFNISAKMTTYASTPKTPTIKLVPQKDLYAAHCYSGCSFSGPNAGEYTTTTPIVDVCITDQNGNAFDTTNPAPGNLVVSGSRVTTTAGVSSAATPFVTTLSSDAVAHPGCYKASHPASSTEDSGVDTYNAYFENNGTPGFQAGSSDVGATTVTAKYAQLTVNGLNTQAVKGSNVTVAFKIAAKDGRPFVGRTLDLGGITGGGNFPTTQPSGTVRTGPNAATCVTDAAGICSVTVTDPNAEDIAVYAFDDVAGTATNNQVPTGVYDFASVSFRTKSIAVTQLFQNNLDILQPTGNTSAGIRPGDVAQYSYNLEDANNGELANVAVSLTIDNGFFTPVCTAATYETCTFDPAAADGAVTGNLKSLGKTFTGTTDDSGDITFAISDGRDALLDTAGVVPVIATVTATGGTIATSAAGSDDLSNFTTNGIHVANGGTVKLLAGAKPNNLSGDVQSNGSNLIPGQSSLISNTGTNFVVHVTDQFGNLVRLNSCDVTLAVAGGGYLTPSAGCARGSFTSTDVGNQFNVDSDSTSTTGQSNTVTATWNAPVTQFKIVTNPSPTPPTVTTPAGTAVAKTDSFTINLYAVDEKGLHYAFANTPGGSVPINTAVTTSVTATDQKSNPVQGLCVQFLRSGPNDAAGNSQIGGSTGPCGQSTNSAGKAGTSYSSGTPGTATVTVIVADDSGNELSRGVVNTVFTSGTPAPSIPTISISTTAINVGKSAVVTVKGKAGDSVTLFALSRPDTAYHVVAMVTLPASGVYSRSITPRGNTRLFARSAAGDSGTVAVSVRPAMSLAGSVSGKTGTFTGTIVPGHGNVTVRIFTVKNGTITLVGTTTTAANGHYTYSRAFAAKGAVTFIAQTLSDGQNLSTQSNRVTVTF
jgi:hypothetical protein